MEIGTEFHGEVERLDGQSIKTAFLKVGMPILPKVSWLVFSSTGQETSGIPGLCGTTREKITGIPLR